MVKSIEELGIIVGYRCNFKCAHCCVWDCSPLSLTSSEKTKIVSVIDKYSPRSIRFVGGEPTLYLATINAILASARDLSASRVLITTNGHFASTTKAAIKVLRSFRKLDSVQLSYDKYHAEFLPFENVKNLYSACMELGLKFCVVYTISSPMDLIGLKKLQSVGKFKILVSKVMRAGAATRNGIEYAYPSFDKGVLRQRCALRKIVGYVCGRGFSLCCSNLMYETALPVAHDSVNEHRRSRFYRLISTMTFGQLLKKAGLSSENLPSRFSMTCNLCEYVFTNSDLIT